MAKKDDSFTIVYQERDAKPTYAITGAYGGPSPDGSVVVAHLYVEHVTIPSLSTHPKEGDRVDLAKGQTIRRADVTRELQATLVMSPETAALLGRFLVEKAALAFSSRGEQPGKQQEEP